MDAVSARTSGERGHENRMPLLTRSFDGFPIHGDAFYIRRRALDEYSNLAEPRLEGTFGRRNFQIQVSTAASQEK